MNERTIIKIIVALLAAVLAIAMGGTDGIYVITSLLFFGVCIGYAEWCERL
jgi:uncharacterized membrane protein